MPFALLLAMQAAGMVVDYLGTKNQQDFADMGAKVQQAGIEANIYQTRLESEDASLQALKGLRQNLSAQAAVFAARGGRPTIGALTQSVGEFKADERMRRMNLIGKENELKAGGTISKLNQAGANTKMWQSFSQRSLNRFPSSKAGWEQGIKDFKQGFGLTSLS